MASTVDTGLPADASREILTLGQLEQHLWGAANILRGPIDQADFKSYIFPLLFFKRICDVYEEEFLDLSFHARAFVACVLHAVRIRYRRAPRLPRRMQGLTGRISVK